MKKLFTFGVLLIVSVTLFSCATMQTNQQRGTAIGAGSGAAVGAILGQAANDHAPARAREVLECDKEKGPEGDAQEEAVIHEVGVEEPPHPVAHREAQEKAQGETGRPRDDSGDDEAPAERTEIDLVFRDRGRFLRCQRACLHATRVTAGRPAGRPPEWNSGSARGPAGRPGFRPRRP